MPLQCSISYSLENGKGSLNLNKGGTKICFQEKIHIKNFFLRLMAPLFWNLKRIQQNYITALKVKVYANK